MAEQIKKAEREVVTVAPRDAYDEVRKRMEEKARKEREEEVDEAEDGER